MRYHLLQWILILFTWLIGTRGHSGDMHILPSMDPYHFMLSLGGIKSFVFARQASARCEFSETLTVQKESSLLPRDSTWPPSDKGLLKGIIAQ